jgi:methionyl-tRNA formyltransferase
MKLVFFGGRHTVDILKSLNETSDLLLAVSTDNTIVDTAVSQKIPFAKVLKLDDKIIQGISKLKPEVGIVADFGLKIPKKLIDVFPMGIINIHPSLLPKYRGPTPVQSAILNGDRKTGLTFIKIDEKIDHGPIIHQEEHDISQKDNSESLYSHLFKRAGRILPEILKAYEKGDLKEKEQDHKNATFTKSFVKEDGFIDIKNPPDPKKITQIINGLHPWPGAWTKYKLGGDKELIIKFHPGGLVHVEGKNPMSYKDFINGYANGKDLLQKLSLI